MSRTRGNMSCQEMDEISNQGNRGIVGSETFIKILIYRKKLIMSVYTRYPAYWDQPKTDSANIVSSLMLLQAY